MSEDPIQSLIALRAARRTVLINGRTAYVSPDGIFNSHTFLGATVELKDAYGNSIDNAPDGTPYPSVSGAVSADDDPMKSRPVTLVDPSHPRSVRCYVKSITDDTLEPVLKDYFSNFGKVSHVQVIKDRATGQHKGNAFVTFAELNDPSAVFGPYCHRLSKRPMYVLLANPSTDKRNTDMPLGVKRPYPGA